jgi:hypothetical protein
LAFDVEQLFAPRVDDQWISAAGEESRQGETQSLRGAGDANDIVVVHEHMIGSGKRRGAVQKGNPNLYERTGPAR